MASPFDVLEVDPDADEGEIERAYRRRVKETHPDLGGSAEAFRRVRWAYERVVMGAGPGGEATTVDGTTVGGDETGGGGHDGGSASGPVAGPDAGTSAGPAGRARGTEARVEYLDFEVLDDYGWGLEDDDLFEKAADADLSDADYGRFLNRAGESLLEAAEARGFAWPYACRGGACANCAVAVTRGELSMPVDHILPAEMLERGIRLSCQGRPITEELQVVYNVKHLPDLDELRLPPRPWRETHGSG